MNSNPKTHDALFKWLITSFTEEFFSHYFPDVRIGSYRFIDKEFISRYEALKESLKGDLFLVMEIEVNDHLQEVVIQIEHQGRKENVGKRVYEYSCYAWLLRQQPVWSIVIYSDDAVWRKRVPDSFWYAFNRNHGQQFFHFDIIKIKDEKSEDLINKHSLLCKLLALKANDKGADPEKLVYEIYLAADKMKDQLTNEQMLLVEQWVNAYKKIPDQDLESIKKEVNEAMIETTITEHIFNKGKMEGLAQGKIEGMNEGVRKGELKGKIEGKIEILENMHLYGVINKEQYEKMVEPLREELKKVKN